MIVNRAAASLWRWLGVNNAPGLESDPTVSFGIQLADASEHGPPNFGVRGAATGLVAAFGTYATWQLESKSPGGVYVTGIGASNTLVGEQLAVLISAVPVTIGGVTVSDTINTGIGDALSTCERGANAGAIASPTFSINVQADSRPDLYIPAGHSLAVQALAVNKVGYLTFQWIEYPEANQND